MASLDANFSRLNQKKFKPNVLYWVKVSSIYNNNTKKRTIPKKQITVRRIANQISDGNKDNVASSLAILKQQQYLLDDGAGNYVVQQPAHESYRNIDTNFARELIRTRNSETVMVYVWMHRRWGNRYQVAPTFTYKDILSQVFQKTYWNGQEDKRIRDIIGDLTASGLISYVIQPVELLNGGKTFVRMLTNVREEFVVKNAFKKADARIMGEENLALTSENIDFSSLSNSYIALFENYEVEEK